MRARTLRHLVLLAAVVVLVAACSGYTTGATNVGDVDLSAWAQLNYVVSCGPGENCSWYVQYRMIAILNPGGPSVPQPDQPWSHVPTTPHGPVAGPVLNVSLSENVHNLFQGVEYEYQVCGNAEPGQPFICVGPDGTPTTTTTFTTPGTFGCCADVGDG